MTLKPCTSAQLQRDLKIRNILDTTKNSSASCVFITRLLKRFAEPGGRSTGAVNCHYFQNLCNPLYINKLPPRKSRIYFNLHRSISSSAIAVYLHLPSQYIFIRHRSISSSAIAVYLPKPGQRVAGRKCPSQSETMIKTSVFYLQPVLSMQPVTVSVFAPVILSVLRDGEQDDRYSKSYKNGHRQLAGVMPPSSGFHSPHSFHTHPLSHSPAFRPCTSSE